jgi:hypothetical protein
MGVKAIFSAVGARLIERNPDHGRQLSAIMQSKRHSPY